MANGDTSDIDLYTLLTDDASFAAKHQEVLQKCLTFAHDLVTDVDLIVHRMERNDAREGIHPEEMMEAIYDTHRREHIARLARLILEDALQRAVIAASL